MNANVDKPSNETTVTSLQKEIRGLKQRIFKLQDRKAAFSWDDIKKQPEAKTFILSMENGKILATDGKLDIDMNPSLSKKDSMIALARLRFDQEIEDLMNRIDRIERRIFFAKNKNKQTNHVTEQDIALAKATSVDTLLSFNRSGFTHCLWHEEKTPSLHFNNRDNTAYCFGCMKNADAIDIVMKLNDVPFFDAVRMLIKK